jgi:hypothetical protein
MYQYDIFISYKRTSAARDWVHQYFAPKLEAFLTDSLPRPPVIFLDARSIEPGDIWNTKIAQGLKHSKCLVAVLNAPYFSSEYCRAEWQTFVDRETLLGLDGALVKPIQFFDGEHYDQAAWARQVIDMRDFASSAPAFRNSLKFLDFEDAVKGLVAKLVALDGPILKPASFQDWPVAMPVGNQPGVLIPQPKLGA